MELIKYIILGIIQGVTEILPISSSGHIIIFSSYLNITNTIEFEIFVHVASLISICFILRKKLVLIIKDFFIFLLKNDQTRKQNFMIIIYVFISTLILVGASLLFSDIIDLYLNNPIVVSILLVINGIMIFLFTNIRPEKNIISIKDALVIGIFEGIGVFPGISRSGSCLCGAGLMKINKDKAAEYAFLLFIPAVLGSLVYNMISLKEIDIFVNINLFYIISFIFSLIFSFISFKFLIYLHYYR